MNGKELLQSMSYVDEDLIQEAAASLPTAKSRRPWQGLVAAAAALCMIIGILFGLSGKTVAYADSTDYSILFTGKPAEKVQFATDFSKFSSNTKVRIMVFCYGMESAYPEIYNQKFDGKTYHELEDEYLSYVEANLSNHIGFKDRWNEVMAKWKIITSEMAAEETNWLRSIGAQDIEAISYNQFLLTMKVSALDKLKGGRCSYRVIQAAKDYSPADISIESLYGEYECEDQVYVSLLSSIGMMTPEMKGSKLTIAADHIEWGTFIHLSNIDYIVDSTKDNAEHYYGFESIDFMYMPDSLVNLFGNGHVILNVSGSNNKVRIFAGDGYVYLDLGLQGVFQFQRIQ